MKCTQEALQCLAEVTEHVSAEPSSAALLIGLNYKHSDVVSTLQGCINDVHQMQEALVNNMGFSKDHVTILTDNDANLSAQEITNAIEAFVDTFKNCKQLWLHFSGHGYHVEDTSGDERDGRDECLVASDGSCISDDFLLSQVVFKLPPDCNLTCVMDCCHSGTQMDLKYRYIGGKRSSFVNRTFPSDPVACNTICLSGCKDRGTSADALMYGKWSGAMTTLLLSCLQDSNFNISCQDLLRMLRGRLRSEGFAQVPQLTSTFPITSKNMFWV